MNVRIDSDGTPDRGTRVIDAETGRELPWVTDIVIHAPLDDLVRAEMTVPLVGLDVIADAVLVGVCPHCGRGVTVLGGDDADGARPPLVRAEG